MIRLTLTLVLNLFWMAGTVWAYPNPYRQTMWNNMTDTLHTIGQPPRQAAWTKQQLRNKRIQTRLGDIRRAKRQAWMKGQ